MKQLITLLAIFSCALSYSQNVGIGTQSPQNKLHLVDTAKDPLRVEQMKPYQIGDSAVLISNPDSGVVRLITITQLGGLLKSGHFFDTTEQITNDTWFDGRTIYTRIIIFEQQSTGSQPVLLSSPNPGGSLSSSGTVGNEFFGANAFITLNGSTRPVTPYVPVSGTSNGVPPGTKYYATYWYVK